MFKRTSLRGALATFITLLIGIAVGAFGVTQLSRNTANSKAPVGFRWMTNEEWAAAHMWNLVRGVIRAPNSPGFPFLVATADVKPTGKPMVIFVPHGKKLLSPPKGKTFVILAGRVFPHRTNEVMEPIIEGVTLYDAWCIGEVLGLVQKEACINPSSRQKQPLNAKYATGKQLADWVGVKLEDAPEETSKHFFSSGNTALPKPTDSKASYLWLEDGHKVSGGKKWLTSVSSKAASRAGTPEYLYNGMCLDPNNLHKPTDTKWPLVDFIPADQIETYNKQC